MCDHSPQTLRQPNRPGILQCEGIINSSLSTTDNPPATAKAVSRQEFLGNIRLPVVLIPLQSILVGRGE